VTTLAELLPIATEAVSRASHMIREQAPGAITRKGDRDPATEVDYAVEREIRDYLRDRTPDIGFLGEEDGPFGDETAEYMWALDPVDGTVNFIHGIPLCAVSLGLVHHETAQLGVIDLPFLNLQYTATLGGGAFLAGQRLHVSGTTTIEDSVIALGDYAVGANASSKNAERIEITRRLASRVQRIRMFGSATIDLAWMAEGRVDACVMLSNKPWETAAGVLVAREAGALVVDRYGEPHTARSTSTIALVPAVRDELMQLLAE
jgi:myo-inositol-1(or 4)-monophosphatase